MKQNRKSQITNPVVISTLKSLCEENDGILTAEAVVEAARPARSPLHSHFEWDNTKAAGQYRIWQARQMLRVVVEYLPGKSDRVERVFVNLTPDQMEDGGGYRPLVTVLSDTDMRSQLLADALGEFQRMEQKYGRIQELAAVFAAVREVARRHKRI